MKCPHCASTVTSEGERCGSCGRSRDGARVAAGVLTPPPSPPTTDQRQTLEGSRVDEDVTRFVVPEDLTRLAAPDDVTRFVAPDDVTRFVAAPSEMPAGRGDTSAPDDVTRFAPADDATRPVVPDDMTRLAPPSAATPGTADDVRRLMSAAEAARTAAADVTRLVSLVEATRIGSDPSQLLSSDAPRAHTDEFTRLVSAAAAARHAAEDATRIVDEYLTRVGAGPVVSRPAAGQDGEGPLAVGQTFGRYHIIRVLGTGGMGAVYHAWDAELGATVALKVIRPEATRDPAVERELERRFKQELVLARKVTHKNVVRIHDLGEIHGIKFISMPYLEGDDLATVLRDRETLPVQDALRIVRDVADGLVAAHEAGIVHRDLKPANIMIQKDLAIIMDFGIARSTAVAEAPGPGLPAGMALKGMAVSEGASTMAGTVVGTMQYMAPEQARGEAVDQRADIYALGLIFTDILVGRQRRIGESRSPLDDLKQRLEHAPPRVRSFNSEIPEALDDFIARCVQPDPQARFQTTKELVAALGRIDTHGNAIRQRKVVGLPLATAVPLFLLLVIGGGWWYYASLIPPPTIPPMSLVIADFENKTGDASFDQTLEPMLRLGLEEASFISAYDRASISRFLTSGVTIPPTLSAAAATELAVNQGVGVVITGVVEPVSRGFGVSIRAIRPVTQEVLASANGRATGKQDVISTVSTLAKRVRSALGDDTADTRFSSRSKDPLSTTSLEVAKKYAVGMNALSNSRSDQALEAFKEAITIDPDFGLAYAGLSIASRNLDRQQDAVKYVDEAIRLLDGMTRRERGRTRGLQFLVTADYKSCVKSYAELIKDFPADAAAHNNLALCATHLRDFGRSLDARREAKKLLPTRSVYRFNLAIDSTYAGDFAAGEAEALETIKLGGVSLGPIALAFSQIAQNKVDEARTTFAELAKGTGTPASRARSGLAEVAAYEGRYAEAVRLFEEGARLDAAAKNVDRAAEKLAGLAYVHLLRRQPGAAKAAAERALATSPSPKVQFLSGRIFAETGDLPRARAAMAALAAELQDEPVALARVLEGNIALAEKKPRDAIRAFEAANDIVDTWIAHYELGRAYLAVGLLTQADSEFDSCLTRRGEALSLFLDDEPTFAYLPALYFYQGRVREDLKTARFAEAYRTYLNIRGAAGEDPLLAEARRRAGG